MTPRNRMIGAALLITILGDAELGRGHDSWLADEPPVDPKKSTEIPAAPDSAAWVWFCTGDHFPISDHATQAERVARWFVQNRQGRLAAVGGLQTDGAALRGRAPIDRNGHPVERLIVAAELHPRLIELTPEKFEAYLREEHAAEALQEFQRSRPTGPVRELYTKHASAILSGKVRVEAAGESGGSPVLAVSPNPERTTPGQSDAASRMEVRPVDWDLPLTAGSEAEFEVLFEGKPRPGLHVASGREGMAAHAYTQTLVTDSRGRVRFQFREPGRWFLRTHTIRKTTDPKVQQAEWESSWASISFRIGNAK